ncbi:MAG TPA: YlbF family regulator [Desulfobacteria bacterium]|nr:YlbF family regulator [Desulfobacteria bacterium]
MSQEIIEQARVLANMIGDSKELANLRDAEQKLANDPIAENLIDEYQAGQQKAAVAQQEGRELNEAEQKEFAEVEQKVRNNTTIKVYLETQNAFNGLLDSVNFLIMKAINGDADACGSTEGCGGCSGCNG